MSYLKTIVPRVALGVLVSAILYGGQARSAPLIIEPGFDLLRTASPTFIDISGIPAGFFGMIAGTPSDPIATDIRIDLLGLPTGPLGFSPSNFVPGGSTFTEAAQQALHSAEPIIDPGMLNTVDTILERTGNFVLLPGVGDSGTFDLEIVSLSLSSVSPIEVTYGGAGTSFFDVFVDLDPLSTQPTGSVTLTRTGQRSGVFDSFLPVISRTTFSNTDPAGPSALFPIIRQDDFTANGVPFRIVSEPATLMLLGFGMALLGYRRRTCCKA